MPRNRTMRRVGTALAATAAFTLAGASMASAHHCYKDDWQAAAYQQQASNKSPWMTLSDLGTAFLIGPALAEKCGYVADNVAADWMSANGVTVEPLIHMKATVGGGALYNSGTEPKPFSYLGEADFEQLTVGIIEGMADCDSSWTPPPMG